LEEGAIGLEFYRRWVTSLREFVPFSQFVCVQHSWYFRGISAGHRISSINSPAIWKKSCQSDELLCDRALLALRVGRGYDLELFVGEIVCPLL
jgi:hypothetical protein